MHDKRLLWSWILLLAFCSTIAAQGRDEGSVDLRHTFFSRRASWIALYPTDQPATLRFVFSRMAEEKGNWLDLTFKGEGGRVPPAAITASASRITVQTGGSNAPRAMAYLVGRFDTVIQTEGLGLDLTSVQSELKLTKPGCTSPSICSTEFQGWTVTVEVLQGKASLQGEQWQLRTESGRLRAVLRMHQGPRPAAWQPDPRRDLMAIEQDWEAFRAKLPAVPENRRRMAEAAWWNLWSLYAPADTNMKTDGVLVAKANMNAIWPWDHCFVAVALGLTDPQAGLDQLLLPFHNADEFGQLPDETSPEFAYRGVTKPPIHGWALMKLMDRHTLTQAQLEDVYPRLVKWTEFWFNRRDTDHNGFPEFGGEHSGWDSGWDNATVLGDPKTKYETPELQAYLVLQMKALSRVARQLGRAAEATEWDRRATVHLQGLMARFWDGQHFLVRPLGGKVNTEPTSLLNLMPLILGENLDKAVFNRLADDLERRFLTPFGPATEDPTSPLYKPDGYWRGPIWAPSTYLLVDGLRRGGREDLARLIAQRFCDLVARAGGNYENYDALTGKGLRCPGFAWTSAVNVLLMHEYLQAPLNR